MGDEGREFEVSDNLPSAFLRYLDSAQIKYTLHKGMIFYHSVEDYKRAKDILIRIGRHPQLNNNIPMPYNSNKVKLIVKLTSDNGLEFDELVTFDSEEEAEYFFYLRDKQAAGEVTKIRLHPRLELFPKITVDGRVQDKIMLTPDFYVEYADGRCEYVDVKGMSNEAGDLRRRLYNYCATLTTRPYFGIPLRWVSTSFKYGDADGWIDYDILQQKRKEAAKAKGA